MYMTHAHRSLGLSGFMIGMAAWLALSSAASAEPPRCLTRYIEYADGHKPVNIYDDAGDTVIASGEGWYDDEGRGYAKLNQSEIGFAGPTAFASVLLTCLRPGNGNQAYSRQTADDRTIDAYPTDTACTAGDMVVGASVTVCRYGE